MTKKTTRQGTGDEVSRCMKRIHSRNEDDEFQAGPPELKELVPSPRGTMAWEGQGGDKELDGFPRGGQ